MALRAGKADGDDKSSRRRKGRDRESRKMKAPGEKVVSENFAGNEFQGVIKEDTLGNRTLEGPKSTYVWPGKARYEGPVTGSEIQGPGKFSWPDGSTYEGELTRGLRHGFGVYVAADGVPKYEGLWRYGKRHGAGRLTYDASGDSYYEGEWVDGCKHGEGRQIWPSGNVYEGQWRLGRKAGHGRMLWRDGGMVEEYDGEWDDDAPQGRGTHTWHAAAPPQLPSPELGSGPRALPSQQMNNRYEGEWLAGLRHGTGVFSFANGARYEGSWASNAKNGQGRYTYEDGRIYNGSFAGDRMTDPDAPAGGHMGSHVLNIGAEGNPVRQCIDISDLEPFALPVDVGMHNLEIGSGYDEAHEVIREVHNMLLRYFGELKNLYAAYRLPLRCPGEDPFVLTAHQLWLLARDMDIISLSCPLSRLNRLTFAGPRQLQERAHADVEDLRPLTPRSANPHGHGARGKGSKGSACKDLAGAVGAAEGAAAAAAPGDAIAGAGGNALAPPGGAGAAADNEESFSSSSGEDYSSKGEESEGQDEAPSKDKAPMVSAEVVDPEERKRKSMAKLRGAVAVTMLRSAHQSKEVCERGKGHHFPALTKFWRGDSGSSENGLLDVHAPSTRLMFRHFLESVVRMSFARFPHEMGLEHQLRRLFKEKILPMAGDCEAQAMAAASAGGAGGIFALLCDEEMRRVFEEFRPQLWELFKANCTGDGAYSRPGWAFKIAHPVSHAAPAPRKEAVGAAADATAAGEGPAAVLGQEAAHPQEASKTSITASGPAEEPVAVAANGGLATRPLQTGRGSSKFVDMGQHHHRNHHHHHHHSHGNQAVSGGLAGGEAAPEGAPCGTETAGVRRLWRRGFAGPHRRSHVSARLDATVRVKDVLRLLDSMGLLAPIADGWPRAGEVASPHGAANRATPDPLGVSAQGSEGSWSMFRTRQAEEAPWSSSEALMCLDGFVFPDPEDRAASALGTLKELDGLMSGWQSVGDALDFGGSRSGIASARESPLPGAGSGTLTFADEGKIKRASGQQDQIPEDTVVAADVTPEEARQAAAECNFQASFVEVLRMILGVMPPKAARRLRWSLGADANVMDEHVAVLEYLETELTFFEFARLTSELAAHGARTSPSASAMPRHRLLAAFFEVAFLPSASIPSVAASSSSSSAATAMPYEPPAPVSGVGAGCKGSEAVSATVDDNFAGDHVVGGAAEGQVAGGTGGGGVGGAPVGEEEEQAPPPTAPPKPATPAEFWRGFDTDLDSVGLGAGGGGESAARLRRRTVLTPKLWPEGYEQEVASW